MRIAFTLLPTLLLLFEQSDVLGQGSGFELEILAVKGRGAASQ